MKNLIITVVLAILVVAGVGMWYIHEHEPSSFGASPQGSSYIGAGTIWAQITNLSAPGANATSTSILNTSGNDLYIMSEHAACEGVGTSRTAYTGTGLASLTVTVATSSTAAPASNGNTNTLPVMTIATSSVNFVISSSTASTPGNGLVSNIWAANSYITFTTNATNTAACTFGVGVLGS